MKFLLLYFLFAFTATLTFSTEIRDDFGKEQLCPDNSTTCKELQTCCLFSGGQYGCCPIREAQCCDDLIHCCPKNYQCNPAQGKCDRKFNDNGLLSIPWFTKLEGKRVAVKEDTECPDGSECSDAATCCQIDDDEYGCCPLPNAICCSDNEHCCPQGFTCDVEAGKCNKQDVSLPFFQKIKKNNKSSKNLFKTTTCPDGKSMCPDDSTCCVLANGDYGCCPLQEAVCCEDKLHCCPHDTTCDVSAGRCQKGTTSVPFFVKIKAIKVASEPQATVPCPGGSGTECPDGNTCCQLPGGQWGCCPLPNAVCCQDHEHCCPSGTVCDVKHGRCNKGAFSVPFFQKIEAMPAAQDKKEEGNLKSVPCPDGQSMCADGQTCCQLPTKEWGCCPLENAVCCQDHEHCCPSNTTCDIKHGRCAKQDGTSVSLLKKVPSKPIKAKKNVCPDSASSCSDESTCCQLSSGRWACCPLPNAVCCEDHLHCCPNGTHCDVKEGRCTREDGLLSIPFFKKTAAETITPIKKVENYTSVVCPDGSSFCPNGNTCCALTTGAFGCCPLDSAVCCSDHMHCCPQNSECDLKTQQCRPKDDSEPPLWASKATSSKVLFKEGSPKVADTPVVCPDNTSCSPLSVCCKMSPDGDYGCCPYADGICCTVDEKGFCCPGDNSCGENFNECVPKKTGMVGAEAPEFRTNWFLIEEKAKKLNQQSSSPQFCPGSSIECSNSSTCCKKSDGSYSCCPYSNGVCCGSHGWCCPHGYRCDPNAETCTLSDDDVSARAKKPTQLSRAFLNEILPDDTTVSCGEETIYSCPKNSTCCQMSEDSYGCCDSLNATCCGNGTCCPKGYKCSNQLCIKIE